MAFMVVMSLANMLLRGKSAALLQIAMVGMLMLQPALPTCGGHTWLGIFI
jgi:hypothetical protein